MNHAAPSPHHRDPAAKAGPNDATLDLVRANVQRVLTRSPSFNALPLATQQQVARDTVKCARYITDAGGETAGTPFAAIINNPAAQQMSAPARQFAPLPNEPTAPDTQQRDFSNAGQDYNPAAANAAGDQMASLVSAVNFPDFVAGLIEGVFNAIVQTSIQQMEAYAAMVANVSKSVDQYMQDNVSEAQAMDNLVSAQPDLFEQDFSGDEAHVAPRQDANPDQMGGFLQSLGLPFDLDASEPETIKQEVVPAMRKSMAMDRQKLLATMVLMGINRIVVTDGKIQASVVFDIDTKDVLRRNNEVNTSFEQDYNRRHKTKSREGFWIFTKSKTTDRARLNVTTNVDTNQTDESESKTNLKAKLTGNVDLRFKSDYFPLEKMLDMLGTNETVITQTAQQPTPQQAQQTQAMTPPPLPPLPGMGGA
ncbi:hypothetical protein [Celeribacter arenosi]|uniref:Uncharacterized protein n=1 Tax=Celeribacter arenosi TaxID=792649 RepID=A0ABP7KIB0_9RHOB